MAVTTAMSALGLAALLALPGAHHAPAPGPSADDEPVPGADTLHVDLAARTEEERLGPGDRVEYTVRIRNSGPEALPDAQVVQFLPSTMRYVSGTAGAETDGGEAVWTRALEPGERASFRVTAEITGVREGGAHPVTTVCLRPEAGAALASCSSAVHRVYGSVPLAWIAAGLLLVTAAAAGAVAHLRRRGTRRAAPQETGAPAPETVPAAETVPAPEGSGGSVPETVPEAAPDGATVHHLDAHR